MAHKTPLAFNAGILPSAKHCVPSSETVCCSIMLNLIWKKDYLSEEIMNKFELISALREKADLSKPEASTVVDLFVDNMADALARGDRVEIRGLCSFSVKKYKSYIGRNPKTGEEVTIKTKKLPFFKAGKELKLRVNR